MAFFKKLWISILSKYGYRYEVATPYVVLHRDEFKLTNLKTLK